MSSITSRPSTPIPNGHNPHKLHHGHTSSYFMYTPQPYTHHSQPLHFHLPSLPVHTPPSLLRRTSSTSSSGSRSRFGLSPMPELVHPTPRRASTLSSSSADESESASPPMPTTPVLASPTAAPPTPLSLPPPAYPKQSTLSPFVSTSASASASAWNYDPFSTSTSDGIEIASYYPHSTPSTKPTRPTLKRRDTPRPKTTTLSSLGMSSIEKDSDQHKMLRSVIDGGNWVIVG